MPAAAEQLPDLTAVPASVLLQPVLLLSAELMCWALAAWGVEAQLQATAPAVAVLPLQPAAASAAMTGAVGAAEARALHLEEEAVAAAAVLAGDLQDAGVLQGPVPVALVEVQPAAAAAAAAVVAAVPEAQAVSALARS